LATDNPDRGYGGYGNTCYDAYENVMQVAMDLFTVLCLIYPISKYATFRGEAGLEMQPLSKIKQEPI
jgi:hypothetical protein